MKKQMNRTSPIMLPIMLNKLRKRLDSISLPLLKKYDLSKLHLLYLVVLFESEDGMTLKELTDFLDFDKANTSRAISQLIAKEYVQKRTQGDLEFKYKIELTPKGRDAAKNISEQNQKANAALLELLTPEELSALSQIAGKLWQFLSEENPD